MNEVAELARVMKAHDLSATDEQIERLAFYCRHLWDWNRRLNLTRHTDFETFVTRDLHDSRQLASLLRHGERILDVGSGGGVPGVPIAILRPDVSVTLCESTRKKAVALESIIVGLSLDVGVFAERGEDLLDQLTFDTLTARAVAPLKRLVPWFRPRCASFQRMLLAKGPGWQQEQHEATVAGLLDGVKIRVAGEYLTVGRNRPSVVLEVRF